MSSTYTNYAHPFAPDQGGFRCCATDKIAERCWTDHERARHYMRGQLSPNSCEHCCAPGQKFPSLQDLNAKREREAKDGAARKAFRRALVGDGASTGAATADGARS